jgi:hypothetical protein
MGSDGESVISPAAINAGLVEAYAFVVKGRENALLIKTLDGLSPFGGSITVMPKDEERWHAYFERAVTEALQKSAIEIGLTLSGLYPGYIVQPYWSAERGKWLVGCAIPIVYFGEQISLKQTGMKKVSLRALKDKKINDQLVPSEEMRRLIQMIAQLAFVA